MTKETMRDPAPGTVVGGRPPGRNEPCPCGSGLKFKRCHNNSVFKQNAFEEAKKAYAVEMSRQIGEAIAVKKPKTEVGQPDVWATPESNEGNKQ